METLVDTAVCAVVTLNDAVVDPSGTATNDGTEATTELEELSATMAPPTADGAVRVTVPLADVPRWTLDAVRLTEARRVARVRGRVKQRWAHIVDVMGARVGVCVRGGGIGQWVWVPAVAERVIVSAVNVLTT